MSVACYVLLILRSTLVQNDNTVLPYGEVGRKLCDRKQEHLKKKINLSIIQQLLRPD